MRSNECLLVLIFLTETEKVKLTQGLYTFLLQFNLITRNLEPHHAVTI